MTEIPIIDEEAIENLRALDEDGGDAFLREVIDIFKDDTPLRIQELRSSLAAGDQPTFTRAAHSVKGSSANIGAARLRALAADLETRSRQSLDDLAGEVDRMEASFQEACAELAKL